MHTEKGKDLSCVFKYLAEIILCRMWKEGVFWERNELSNFQEGA